MFANKSSHTIRWFRSILLVLFPCLALCVLLCVYMIHTSKKNVLEINSAITNHVQKNLDSRLKEINRYALTIEVSSNNTLLKNLDTPSDSIPRQAYRLADTLRDFLVTNSFVKNTYIYYPKANLVVGNHGCFDSNSYYTLQEYPNNAGYPDWIDTLNSAKGMSIQDLSYHNRQNICFIHKMETSSTNTAIMVFEMDFDQLLQDFEPGDHAEVLSIGILKKENLIASVGNMDTLKNIRSLYSKWGKNSGNIVRIDDTYAFFYPSSVPKLTYVTVYTARQLTKALYFPLAATLAGVILCAVIGISGAVFISTRNGRPMDRLLMSLGKKTNSEDDDYQFILRKFEQMTEGKDKYEEYMQKHQILLNSVFLSSLLQENFQNENEIFTEVRQSGVTLEYPYFQIIILTSLQKKGFQFTPEMNILYDYLEQIEYNGLITLYQHRYVVLLNTDSPIPKQEQNPVIETIQGILFPESPSLASVGNWCDSMSDIINSYHNALTTLHRLTSIEDNMIVFYREAKKCSDHGNTDLMKIFSSLIYSKEFLKSRQLLPQLSCEYLNHENIQTETLRQNALTNLLTDAAYTTLPWPQAVKEVNLLLKTSESKEAYLQQADLLLKYLQNCVLSQNDSKALIASQAKQYIDDHFTDPMLGLYMVSDQLNISNSYLSSTFKKVYGINVIQYINQLRIEQAKILILNTRKNIKEIAQDVGFSSDINFIRVFKKMENQTPTMLRKQKHP